jgi:hypothetical protein
MIASSSYGVLFVAFFLFLVIRGSFDFDSLPKIDSLNKNAEPTHWINILRQLGHLLVVFEE